jgi:WXXGXW repeat (2 copies)
MRKFLLTALFGIAMGIGSAQAEDVVIKTRPPRAVVETRPARPSPAHVWIAGYHRWDGNAYAWTPGRWEAPPRPHAVWVAPRYVHKNGGYVFVEGRWK